MSDRPIVAAAKIRLGFVRKYGTRMEGDEILLHSVDDYVVWCETHPEKAPHPIRSLDGVLLK